MVVFSSWWKRRKTDNAAAIFSSFRTKRYHKSKDSPCSLSEKKTARDFRWILVVCKWMLWPYDIPLNPHLLAGDPYVMVYYKSPRSWVEFHPTKTLIHWPVAWGSKKINVDHQSEMRRFAYGNSAWKKWHPNIFLPILVVSEKWWFTIAESVKTSPTKQSHRGQVNKQDLICWKKW